ncbi:MAG: glycosyltransferase [Telluria sp.]
MPKDNLVDIGVGRNGPTVNSAYAACVANFLDQVFDEAWYAGAYPSAANRVASGHYTSLLQYFLTVGVQEGHSPGPLYDSSFLRMNAEITSFESFMRDPRRVAPCPLFDENFYCSSFADVATAIVEYHALSGFDHFLRYGFDESRRPSPLVLPLHTRKALGWLTGANAKDDLLCILDGRIQGGVLFDSAWYAAQHHTSITQHGVTPLQHFLNRAISINSAPIPDFDEAYYVRQHGDVQQHIANGGDAALHFILHGVSEERAPNEFFDPTYYQQNNSIVRQEIGNYQLRGSFEHFLLLGAKRGLRARLPLFKGFVPEIEGKAIFERQAEMCATAVLAGKKINLPRPKDPTCSIIIPAVNNFAFTLRLLGRLAYSVCERTEVILVDSASTDETRRIEHYVGNLKVVRLEDRSSFSKTCNSGAAEAVGETLLFMNNDIDIESDAIDLALQTLDSDLTIGCVGGRIVRTHGLLQEAGCVIWSNGSTQGLGRDAVPTEHNYMVLRDVDMVSACFIGIRRTVFDLVAGFNEIFDPGYHEDTDLNIRIWKAGYRVVCNPMIVIHHFEYGSYSKGRPPSASSALIIAHREKVTQLHGDYLRTQLPPGGAHPLLAGDRRYRNGKNILLIEDRPPERRFGSGYVRTTDVITGLQAAGFNVVVWARERGYDQGNFYPDLANVAVFHADEFEGSLANFLDQNGKIFTHLWVCRTHNMRMYYADLIRYRDQGGGAKIYADTEALTSAREIAQRKVFGAATNEAVRALKNEVRLLGIADRILTVSEAERKLVLNGLPTADCRILSHMPDFPASRTPTNRREWSARKIYGFLGAVHSNDSPNFDSIVWLCNFAFPHIRQRDPSARLVIAGYWDSRVARDAIDNCEGIEFIGPIDDLDAFFSEVRVFLAPTRFAAGLPQKIATAAMHGVPSVVSPLLDEQLGWGTGNGYLTPDKLAPETYAQLATTLFQDYKVWASVRNAGITTVTREHGREAFARMIQDSISTTSESS